MANKVILAGNLGKDPEMRHTPGGAAVCSFSLATKEKFKDRDGNRQEETEWHNIVAWRQLAEICDKYLSKGSQIYVEGKIKTRKWEDRDGNTRYTTEIVIDHMEMLGGGRNNRNEDGGKSSGQSEQQQQPVYEEPVFNPDDEIPF